MFDLERRGNDGHKMGPKLDWHAKAVEAMQKARDLPPGAARHEAMKKAGLMRRMAEMFAEIQTLEQPIRGKRPRKRKAEITA
jgi:hypothetical protein